MEVSRDSLCVYPGETPYVAVNAVYYFAGKFQTFSNVHSNDIRTAVYDEVFDRLYYGTMRRRQ